MKSHLIKTKNLINKVSHWALNVILPPQCLSCSVRIDKAHNICPNCWKDLNFISEPMCDCCGYPFEFQVHHGNIGKNLCGQCLSQERSFDKAISALRYDTISRKMIIGYKHHDRTEFAVFFAKLLQQIGNEILNQTDIIIPVPLHQRRLFKRRYNQSALIAEILSKEYNIKHVPELLVRIKNTPPQEGNVRKRAKNVRGAFKINPEQADKIKGKTILLIDDVYTTGATIENCSIVLKKSGAETINVMTVTRVITPKTL